MSGKYPDSHPGGLSRREFIGGVTAATLLGSPVLRAAAAAPAPAPANAATRAVPTDPAAYPPLRTGLRGQHPGSFEAAHAVRDGLMAGPLEAESTGEHYDLVVVGGGISGLSAAYLYQKALGSDKKVLVLDNHDDFGGHAKRNEFHHGGRVILTNGGSMNTHSPFPYSHTALSLLAELGFDPGTYAKYHRPEVYQGLGQGVFFDAESFGADEVVTGYTTAPWTEFFAAAPLPGPVRDELIRLYTETVDYMPDLDPAQKARALQRISYRDFLLGYAGVSEACMPFFAGMSFRNSMRIDTCPAYLVASLYPSAPGFGGMRIERREAFHSQVFRFPDGNASVARLLVNRLVPGVFEGVHDMESIVTAQADYASLDLPSNPARIRLSSPVVRVEHLGTPDAFTEQAVVVGYMRDEKLVSVTAANVVLACFNNIVRFIAPEIEQDQKQALSYASKVPIQYTKVLVRNWRPWQRLGIRSIYAPNGYHTSISLEPAIRIGGYASAMGPDEPVVLHLSRNPNMPGLNRKEQNRMGRFDMLGASLESIEAEVRSQLDRMLGPAGFDAERDILGITVNRWPHGYAYTYDTLNDPDLPGEADRPHVKGRKPFGRIAIANVDAAASSFINTAIDQAARAVDDCLVSRGLI